MEEEKTQETQYQEVLNLKKRQGLTSLGLMTNVIWHEDPRRLAFLLSRYKFVSKMLSGSKRVLEVGCGDAFGTRVVLQEVDSVCVVDFDPLFIKDIQDRMEPDWPFECRVHDMLKGPVEEASFDAAYSLDVLEHIAQENEDKFLANIVASLSEHGVLIIGSPSIQSQAYASVYSKEGHINCKDHREFKTLLLKYFHNVFLFSMNDEIVHTGFYPMAHYLMALCSDRR